MEPNRWERKGECNHCGFCCEYLGSQKIGAFVTDAPDEDYLRVRGFRQTERDGVKGWLLTGYIHTPCPQHQANRCAIWLARPKSCSDWPVTPEQILGTPCSYWFERVVDGVVQRLGGAGGHGVKVASRRWGDGAES